MNYKLTDNQKLVLLGLAEYFGLNDTEFSKKLGIERRTFSAVKTKLKKNNIFSIVIVPTVNTALGCEILTVFYGTFTPSAKFERRADSIKMVKECEEIVYSLSTDKEFFMIAISKNFTEFTKKADEMLRFYRHNGFIDDITVVHFPFEVSQYRFFEFSAMMKNSFGRDVESARKDVDKIPEQERLTNKEKKVLYALVRIPEANISEISNKTRISTQTISKLKKKFLEKNIATVYAIPDFNIFDCELLVLVHTKYKRSKKEERICIQEEILKFTSEADSVSILLFRNYTDYKNYYDKKVGYLKTRDIIDDEPVVQLFPVKNLRHIKEFSFAPLVKKVLGVDAKF